VEFGQHDGHKRWTVCDCLRIALGKLGRLAATPDDAFGNANVELSGLGRRVLNFWSRRFGKAIDCGCHPHATALTMVPYVPFVVLFVSRPRCAELLCNMLSMASS